MSTNRSKREDPLDESTDMLTPPQGALLRPSMSRSKLTKTLNRLLYRGDIMGLRKVIDENKGRVQACLPYLANQKFRETVKMYLEG